MSDPRDHHFIPAFYLKNWARPDGRLTEYSMPHGRVVSKSVGPKGTGYMRDLYAFPELSEKDSQHLERVFFDYADRTANAALKIHLTDTSVGWTPELSVAWARFVVGIHLRHPDSMPELRAGAAAAWESSGEDSQARYEAIRRPTDPATFDEYLEKKDPLTKHKMQLNFIIKALENMHICSHITKMTWAVANFVGEGVHLLTSDRPVEIFALAKPKGVITIPLTPTKLFIAANDPLSISQIGDTPARTVIERVNLSVVARARHYIWAQDSRLQSFIETHMSTGKEPTPFYPSLKFSMRRSDQPFLP